MLLFKRVCLRKKICKKTSASEKITKMVAVKIFAAFTYNINENGTVMHTLPHRVDYLKGSSLLL